jgi:hypothetical protein
VNGRYSQKKDLSPGLFYLSVEHTSSGVVQKRNAMVFKSSHDCLDFNEYRPGTYNGGAQVYYEGSIYEAKYWNQNIPTKSAWKKVRDCQDEVGPSVQSRNPSKDSVYSKISPINLSASATPPSGSSVNGLWALIYKNGNLVDTLNVAQLSSATWTPSSEGVFDIVWLASSDNNGFTRLAPVRIQFGENLNVDEDSYSSNDDVITQIFDEIRSSKSVLLEEGYLRAITNQRFITIRDVMGKKFNFSKSSSSFPYSSYNISDLKAGHYFLEVDHEKGVLNYPIQVK